MPSQDIVRNLQFNTTGWITWSATAQRMDRVNSVMMTVVSCLLLILGLTFGILYIKKRLYLRNNPISNVTYSPNNDAEASETKSKAFWLRLTTDERAKVLQVFCEKRIFLYKNEAGCSNQVSAETDVEQGELAATLSLGGATGEMMNEQISSDKHITSTISGQGNSKAEISMVRKNEPVIEVRNGQEKEAANLEEERIDPTAEAEQGETTVEVDDMDHERSCCICLSAYEEGNQLITGTQCNHVFHYACCMAWLNKNVQCPYCRRAMITEPELLQAAWDVLEPERLTELSKAENFKDTESSGIVVGVSLSTTISTPSTSNGYESAQASHQEMVNENESAQASQQERVLTSH